MKASDFVNDLRKKFPEEYKKNGDRGIAERLGISPQTLRKWSKSGSEIESFQITNAFIKAQDTAVTEAQYNTIKPKMCIRDRYYVAMNDATPFVVYGY